MPKGTEGYNSPTSSSCSSGEELGILVVLWPGGHMNVICFGVQTLGIGLCLLPLMVPLARVIFRVVILC